MKARTVPTHSPQEKRRQLAEARAQLAAREQQVAAKGQELSAVQAQLGQQQAAVTAAQQQLAANRVQLVADVRVFAQETQQQTEAAEARAQVGGWWRGGVGRALLAALVGLWLGWVSKARALRE